MYSSLCRRGGDNRPADAHARQVSAELPTVGRQRISC